MAKDKGALIVIKKGKGGHAAPHGGAWKVAYADFVTAMMAFFLVMWLLGSDEETKASVANYFNNPTSAWRIDLSSKDAVPLGDMTGAGDDVMNGAQGAMPDDLVQRPQNITKSKTDTQAGLGAVDELLSDQGILKLDILMFSIEENEVFKADSTTEWTPKAETLFKKLSEITKKYKGTIQLRSYYHSKTANDSELPGGYEYHLSRLVNLEKQMVKNDIIQQENVSSKVLKSEGIEQANRIEFLLKKNN